MNRLYTLGEETATMNATLALLAFATLSAAPQHPLDWHPTQYEEIEELFQSPPASFSSGPLWVWNDWMTEERIVSDLDDLVSKNVLQAFIHPRPGLMTPYLSDRWFDLYGFALKEAEKRGMLLWIYDENSYPSGFAGGHVPEQMPESVGKGLMMVKTGLEPLDKEGLLAVFRVEGETAGNITESVDEYKDKPGDYYAFRAIESEKSPWYGGRTYVDLIHPGVTEKFLEITLDPYKERFGDQFGTMILGSFQDEAEIRPTGRGGAITWSDGLDERFEARFGYPLTEHFPSLFLETGDWKKVRHNFYDLLLAEFIEHWAVPYSEYCAENNLAFTGHYWEHDWPNMFQGPDTMAMYQWHQVPAIDCLFNQYNEGTHGQFGNLRMVRELASVANQTGAHRRLCEIYGGGGWDLRFEDMKRIADWNGVLGVNLFNQHLTHTTLRGARKHDYPQSFSYHAPWWSAYGTQGDYLARLSLAMTAGEQINRILVLQPTTTAWMYMSSTNPRPELQRLGERFQSLLLELEDAGVEYDLGSEDVMARHGSVKNGNLVVGEREYAAVVIPEDMENLQSATLDLLNDFEGALLSLREAPPQRVDGKAEPAESLWEKAKVVDRGELPAALYEADPAMPRFARDEGAGGILYHQRRVCEDGQLLFLVNTSLDGPSRGSVSLNGRGVKAMDTLTGAIEPYPFEAEYGIVSFEYDLPPAGSLLAWVSNEALEPAEPVRESREALEAAGGLEIRREDWNALTLDICSVEAGGESLEKAYFYQAQQFIFNQHGMEQNPWDHSVQYKDEIISTEFPEDSGFTAGFPFVIEGEVPATLKAVVERPDLYAIELNGTPVKAAPGEWWLDRAFGVIDIAAAAKTGGNLLILKASPMTVWHELERVFILGNFGLEPVDDGFKIVEEPQVTLGSWREQGHPFYSGKVTYSRSFGIDGKADAYKVVLAGWNGSVAEVSVNGEPAGVIGNQPWECDITGRVEPGTIKVEVTVTGNLKNLLGPHHGNPPLGIASPWAFRRAPESVPPAGGEYGLLDYGLFEPFAVEAVTYR